MDFGWAFNRGRIWKSERMDISAAEFISTEVERALALESRQGWILAQTTWHDQACDPQAQCTVTVSGPLVQTVVRISKQ